MHAWFSVAVAKPYLGSVDGVGEARGKRVVHPAFGEDLGPVDPDPVVQKEQAHASPVARGHVPKGTAQEVLVRRKFNVCRVCPDFPEELVLVPFEVGQPQLLLAPVLQGDAGQKVRAAAVVLKHGVWSVDERQVRGIPRAISLVVGLGVRVRGRNRGRVRVSVRIRGWLSLSLSLSLSSSLSWSFSFVLVFFFCLASLSLPFCVCLSLCLFVFVNVFVLVFLS
jgi:hypothetical protein